MDGAASQIRRPVVSSSKLVVEKTNNDPRDSHQSQKLSDVFILFPRNFDLSSVELVNIFDRSYCSHSPKLSKALLLTTQVTWDEPVSFASSSPSLASSRFAKRFLS